MTDESIAPLDRLTAERACERLVVQFAHELDLGEPGRGAEVFTADGVWEWAEGDRRVEGREALRGYFGARPADRLSRRICTNILVTLTSASTATATTYFTTSRVDGHSGGMLPPRPPDAGRPLRGHLPQRRRAVAAQQPGPVPGLRRAHRERGPGGRHPLNGLA